MTAGSAANTAISNFCEWGSMNFNSLHHSYYYIFYSSYLKKVFEIDSFSSQTCITSNT